MRYFSLISIIGLLFVVSACGFEPGSVPPYEGGDADSDALNSGFVVDRQDTEDPDADAAGIEDPDSAAAPDTDAGIEDSDPDPPDPDSGNPDTSSGPDTTEDSDTQQDTEPQCGRGFRLENGQCEPVCGDGLLRGNEVCDEGANNGNICTPGYESSCTWCSVDCSSLTTETGPSCGDGNVDGPEECDGGPHCTINCACATGYVPGNNGECYEEDLCETHHCNPGLECRIDGSTGSPYCANIDECADSNLNDCGANEICVDKEPSSGDLYVCECRVGHKRVNGACVLACGDGQLDSGEACDDGNTVDGDGCNSSCQIEPGWQCDSNSNCWSICGDGLVVGNEQCDDGNTVDGDGCDSSCQIETGWSCDSSGCSEVCGDGLIVGSEQCDDSNSISGDGCSSGCQVETGWDCGSGYSCSPICGDGLEVGIETLSGYCDDGAQNYSERPCADWETCQSYCTTSCTEGSTAPLCATYQGSFLVERSSDLTQIQSYCSISGDLVVDTTATGVLLDNFMDSTTPLPLQHVGGDFVVQCDSTKSFEGVNQLIQVDGDLQIDSNGQSTYCNHSYRIDVSALSNLEWLGGRLHIWNTGELAMVSNNDRAFDALEYVGGDLTIHSTDVTTGLAFDFFPNLTTVAGQLRLENISNSIVDLNGFASLQSVGSKLTIRANSDLSTLSGCGSLHNVGTGFELSGPSLPCAEANNFCAKDSSATCQVDQCVN